LADERVALFVDEGAYATLDWGAERAAGRGVPVRRFAHHDPDALARAVSAERSGRPIVVAADGLCPRCGRAAPVDDYLAAAARRGSRLVLDDTQAMGIAGPAGGGTLRACHPRDPRVLVIASFAKGFAAPVAVLAGSARAVAGYERASACRVHSSPPSVAALRALDRALRINQATGDVLRARLAHRIDAFRAGIAALGIEPAGRPFPVQRVTVPGVDALGLSEQLACMGVRTAVAAGLRGPELLFVLRADHRPTDLGRALAALARAADLAMV
jgi:8-amino-7-oxononanoate synthase